jgi:hypothetical protein
VAVHLNARLHSRFIPILFSMAVALVAASSVGLGHAHAAGEPTVLQPSALDENAPLSAVDPLETTREEIRALVQDSHPEYIERTPGFSPITVVPEKSKEPIAGIGSSDQPQMEMMTDQLQTQPLELSAEQR